MAKLISSPATAIENIRRFEAEVCSSPAVQGRLAYARAWYAYKDELGTTHFGPSKFVGYQGLTAADYIGAGEDDRDGRRTEAQLRQWFAVIDPTSQLHDELNASLVEFLARFGKAPSTKMRINVLREVLETREQPDQLAAIVDLMVAVARLLPPSQLDILRKRLAG
ncbi:MULTISPECIES: hypothetical protein [Roseomonadaceae]|uniref:Uncharacterized protein n=1 Tax=Falsiroseomonas oleicola TaxID=2801474 RepID=A0ABS6HEP4_9PROT|nr:hypothetical protein [Roseomonas oleicola]MBU8546433.1 hypothetical protein [Roseomonas oleicola]